MKAYQLQAGAGTSALVQTELSSRPLGPREVRVRMRAAALNARDLAFARGAFYNPPSHPIVPLVDGCGDVVEIGTDATRFAVGERVITNYYPRWIDGAITPAKTAVSFGAQLDGTLAEELVTDQDGLVRAPASLDDKAAATLSCAGLTAWHALFGVATLRPGASVLLLGTGGVSIWALQLASAAGLFPIITSSQDAKLERAIALGARGTVNYRDTPEWEQAVIELTQGQGTDLVVEVGGEGTLSRSLQASRAGGTVVVVGRVTGGGGVSIEPGALIGGAKHLAGITTGSRTMLEDLVQFVDSAAITPAIDKVFGFSEAREAYDYVAHGQHFGKTVIDFGL